MFLCGGLVFVEVLCLFKCVSLFMEFFVCRGFVCF